MPTSVELTPMIGVGVGDLQDALRAELPRIIKQTKGNELAQTKLLNGRLRDLNLVSEAEVRVLNRLATIGDRAGGKDNASDAYFESRDQYNTLLSGGDASPVALVLAASAVGSYAPTKSPDGSGGVVYKKSSGGWEGRGAAAGAIIGGAIGGAPGAAIGGAIGGLVGHAVDECED